MSWDNEKSLTFIKEYQKRAILWQKSDKHYYDVVKKEDAWREISEILDEDIATLKKKIDSLRGSRRREKTRMLQSRKPGKGRTNVYNSRWFAWDALKFLGDPEELQTTTTTSINIKNEDRDSTTQQPPKRKPVNSTPSTSSSPQTANQMMEAFTLLKNVVSQKDAEKEDECDLYGKMLAKKLRKLPEFERQFLMHDIDGIVLNAYSNVQSSSVSSQPSHDENDSTPNVLNESNSQSESITE